MKNTKLEKGCPTTIVRNTGNFRTYWTVEIDKKFKTKRDVIEANILIKRVLKA